jgi:FG-GAP-like repeat
MWVIKSRQKVITGDLNGDGTADLITLGSEAANLLLGQADGSFQVKQFNPFTSDFQFDSNSKLQIIDVNKDGKLDLAISGTDSSGLSLLKVYTLNGSGELTSLGNTTKLFSTTGQNPTFEKLVDLNGDGIPELLTKVSDTQLGVFKNISNPIPSTTLTKSYTHFRD